MPAAASGLRRRFVHACSGPKSDVRYSPESRLNSDIAPCPKGAMPLECCEIPLASVRFIKIFWGCQLAIFQQTKGHRLQKTKGRITLRSSTKLAQHWSWRVPQIADRGFVPLSTMTSKRRRDIAMDQPRTGNLRHTRPTKLDMSPRPQEITLAKCAPPASAAC
jgi:hypothetical protein